MNPFTDIPRYKPLRKKRSSPRSGPLRDPEYRRWVSRHICCVCWGIHPDGTLAVSVSQAAHTINNGMSSKGPDSSCIPLCVPHHQEFDKDREGFAQKHQINPQEIAKIYYAAYLKLPRAS